jgi:hypothetical protein
MDSTIASYRGHRSPPVIISHAVWLSHRFCLSVRDVEDLLAPSVGSLSRARASATGAGSSAPSMPAV